MIPDINMSDYIFVHVFSYVFILFIVHKGAHSQTIRSYILIKMLLSLKNLLNKFTKNIPSVSICLCASIKVICICKKQTPFKNQEWK